MSKKEEKERQRALQNVEKVKQVEGEEETCTVICTEPELYTQESQDVDVTQEETQRPREEVNEGITEEEKDSQPVQSSGLKLPHIEGDCNVDAMVTNVLEDIKNMNLRIEKEQVIQQDLVQKEGEKLQDQVKDSKLAEQEDEKEGQCEGNLGEKEIGGMKQR